MLPGVYTKAFVARPLTADPETRGWRRDSRRPAWRPRRREAGSVAAPLRRPEGWLVLSGRLPGDHPPVAAALRVDGEIADGEPILLAVALHVHVRHTVDDADIAADARL